jgi:hypothetical protein
MNPGEPALLKLLILWFMIGGAILMPAGAGQSGARPKRCIVRPLLNPATYREDVMAAKRWNDLDESTRKLIIAVAVAEGSLKVAALIDIKRRPASQIRGPKWLWVPVVAVVNSAGMVPISNFVFGRRQPRSPSG